MTTEQSLSEKLSETLAYLFARDEFTATLLGRSFTQMIGWAELALVLALAMLAWLAAHFITRKQLPKIQSVWLKPLLLRVMLPLLLTVFGTVGLLGWWATVGVDSLWLRLMVFAANWMLAIRLILGGLHFLLPEKWLNHKRESFLATLLWVYFLFWVSGIDDLLIGMLRGIQFAVGKSTLNVWTLLTGLLWVGLMLAAMMSLGRWLGKQLMQTDSLDINLRIVLSKIIQAALLILSVLIALPLVGIDLTVLSVFGGALGVGLGFGLQKIASNYVSGFIILADRSIRPNDRLTVNGFTGYVTAINARFVVLRSASGPEALIPNETFVTSTVINESYTGKSLYQSLDVQVAYHTDLTKALRILQEAAAAQERVEKEPKAFLTNFGENGIDLRVGFWVKDPENGFAGLNSAILLAIWQRFNEEGIDFPFPQREIRILPDEQNPSDLALLKAQIHAKHSQTVGKEFDDDDEQ
ncbi:mechanosensitive ion channel family protein [Alysiella crassa]|uniref:Potassium efflux system KefA n=1 Tax=Alysiella crassa TaxID=153491 RepID=A0A376BS34_9NEIS|nr:mechanosensitive ion channel domain-containing protein [Alysiella crassa]SSY79709.1 Potassium efflux system KefA precursor [Alysiella crassa]